ncbi:MAG: hypothetical protein GKR92_09450 [Gammaproteobacteria bacterium]|nr:MAG: hypothetical protein GKR92_09450 [Gammaproteobacteria bacterium]
MMQQQIAMKIREYLPEINASEINFDEKDLQPYEDNLKQFTESILTWSHTILEKAKLPTLAHEAKPLVNKYSIDSDEGCALRMVIELDALNSSLANRDAGTAALASMKLLENVWYSSIFKIDAKQNTKRVKKSATTNSPVVSKTKQTTNDSSQQLYQETINNLKDKYPHCNVNALRLLAATRLNVSKQELDDLDISPE